MFFAVESVLGISNSTWQTIGAILGIIVVAAGLVSFVIRTIFKIASFNERMKAVEKDAKSINQEIKDTREALTKRIDSLIDISIQRGLSEANSPRQLTEEGNKVLKNSGIDTVVDEKFDLIVRKVDEKKPDNAYQAEQAVLDVVEHLAEDETIKDAVENGAFQSGYPIQSVLYVGGIYIRDRVLENLGFQVSEIDNHEPTKKR